MLNTKYQSLSNAVASYSFVDIASGTGYITLYAGLTEDLKVLSNTEFYSHTIYSEETAATTSFTKEMDCDFDVLINRPTYLKGTCIVNLPTKFIIGNGAYAGSVYHKIIIRKWDGTTETDIISHTLDTTTGNSETIYKMNAVGLVLPLTLFKVGDTLRITIEGWGKVVTAGGTPLTVGIAHDPKGRATDWDATVPSIFTVQIPVRVDV